MTGRPRRGKPKPAKTTKPGRPAPGTVKAAFAGVCPVCGKPTKAGATLKKVEAGWAHLACAEFEKNKRDVLEGRTYRGRKPSDWKRGQGPGSAGESPR